MQEAANWGLVAGVTLYDSVIQGKVRVKKSWGLKAQPCMTLSYKAGVQEAANWGLGSGLGFVIPSVAGFG